MVRFSTTILLCLFLASCSPEKRIQRIVEKHPHLVQNDTIIIHDTTVIQSYNYDTTTVLVENKTVEVINNEKLRLVYRYDTLTREIHHDVECKGDTIIKIHEVPVETIKIQPGKSSDFKFWALLCAIILGMVVFIIKR